MKRLSILIISLAFFTMFSMADDKRRPSKEDRERWFKEMREYKHNFITKELDLTKQQQEEFFPVYDAMEDECHKVHYETRKMQREIKKKKESEVTDIEYEKAAEALFEIKAKESAIEMKYFNLFKEILTKKQLFLFKDVEDKFTRHLMRQHNKHSKKDKNKD